MSILSNNILVKNLTEYGLSDKEAKMYLALLGLEVGTVNEAAKVAGVNRSSAYVVLEALKEKGLVSVSGDKKIQHYVATSPEVLLYSAESRAQKQENIKDKIADIVPELKALHKDTKQKPKVQVFEGKQGLNYAFMDSLNIKEKLIRVSSSADGLPGQMADYFRKRVENGIRIKGIHPITKVDRNFYKILRGLSLKSDEAIFIPKEKYNFSANLAIYDNKIAYLSAKNGGGAIIIESEEISSLMKSLFDLAFAEVKRIGKTIGTKEI